MELTPARRDQRGATLIIGLIMLTVITLFVVTAFTLSSTNLKAVGNMQFRDEAMAAANIAIEQVISGFVVAAPLTQDISIDLNNDSVADYLVHIVPTCITSAAVSAGSGLGKKGSAELGTALGVGGGAGGAGYLTIWDIDATVTDTASGASLRLHQAIRKKLTADCT